MDSDDDHEYARREWKLRAGAIPGAVVLALIFHSCDTGHFVQRTALTMPLHELGHAITAWWCGFGALPTLWKTMIPEARGTVTPLLFAALNLALVARGWMTQRTWMWVLGGVLGVLQIIGTMMISEDAAYEAFTFGGDAGAMILGTALMLTFFVGQDSKLRTGGARWGLLSIGAAAFIDTAAVWWTARTDRDAIPFGEIEGVGLSDPSKLEEVHGWTTTLMVDRYVDVATLCMLTLVAVWLGAVWRARRRAQPIEA
jgi:hypothetical protein